MYNSLNLQIVTGQNENISHRLMRLYLCRRLSQLSIRWGLPAARLHIKMEEKYLQEVFISSRRPTEYSFTAKWWFL